MLHLLRIKNNVILGFYRGTHIMGNNTCITTGYFGAWGGAVTSVFAMNAARQAQSN